MPSMRMCRWARRGAVVVAVALAGCAMPGLYASDAKSAKARPVLWVDPGDIAGRDLYWGNGSAEGAPQPPFTFVEENLGGTNPKIKVTDARGRTWKVKFTGDRGNEVHAEIAAGRLAWALGYFTEEHYFVGDGRIEKLGQLARAATVIQPDGRFQGARFERRPAGLAEADGRWSLADNPFQGTKELSGLKLLSAMLHHWDLKYENFGVMAASRPDGTPELRYVLIDLGSTFGRMARGLLGDRTKWDLEHYRGQDFLAGADARTLKLNHRSCHPFDQKIPIEHARWFAGLVSQLQESQVRRAFEAAGANAAEVAGFTAAFTAKVTEIVAAVDRREMTRSQ